MDDGERRLSAVRPRQRHQHAVGAEREHRDARLVRPDRVSRDTPRAGFGPVDDGRMRLEAERERLLVRVHLRAQSAPVLVDALHLVAGAPPEVQRLERPFADAPDPGRENDVVRPVDLPAEERHAHPISSRAASSSDSRPSSSPFSFLRRSSPRISPTRGDSPRPRPARSAPEMSRRTPRSRSKYSCSRGEPVSARAKSGASGSWRSAAATMSAAVPSSSSGDPRPLDDRRLDLVPVQAADLEPLEPRGDLRRRQLAGERLEAEPPGGHREVVVPVELAETIEELDRLLIRDHVRMHFLLRAQLGQTRDRVADIALLEQRNQLIA